MVAPVRPGSRTPATDKPYSAVRFSTFRIFHFGPLFDVLRTTAIGPAKIVLEIISGVVAIDDIDHGIVQTASGLFSRRCQIASAGSAVPTTW